MLGLRRFEYNEKHCAWHEKRDEYECKFRISLEIYGNI